MIRDPKICKYPFLNMKVGDYFELKYRMYLPALVLKTSKAFCDRNNLDWKFKTKTKEGIITITRFV